jgi:hypothetical protein
MRNLLDGAGRGKPDARGDTAGTDVGCGGVDSDCVEDCGEHKEEELEI